MKPTRLAFLYNVRHRYPDPRDPRSQLETDFDDPQTIRAIVKHLKNAGLIVYAIEANERAYAKLMRLRSSIDLVFNFAEGIYGADREAQMPAILEMLQLPYTGSTPLTHAIVFNKAKTKEVLLANGISTLPFQLLFAPEEKLRRGLRYPLIVKPVAQGSSAGITNASVVNNVRELKSQVRWILNNFSQPALIEPFITGREFSVAMAGNPPRILPIIEADHSLLPKGYQPLDSLEVKWFFEEESEANHLRCPARLTSALRKKIEALCLNAWKALEIRDWCRVDIRCDANETPYVIEVNTPAGLLPPEISTTSYFPLAARAAGIEYEALLTLIIDTAKQRLAAAPKKRLAKG